MKKKILLIIILAVVFLTTLVSRNNLDKSSLSVYINDEYQEKIPTKDAGYYVEKVTCDNGASGTWDYTNWGLLTTNLTKKNKCNIYFKDSTVYDKSANNFTAVLKNGASIKTDDNNIKYTPQMKYDDLKGKSNQRFTYDFYLSILKPYNL